MWHVTFLERKKKLPLLYSCIGYNSQGFQRVEKGWAGPSTVNTLLSHPLPAHHPLLHVSVFHNSVFMYMTSEQGSLTSPWMDDLTQFHNNSNKNYRHYTGKNNSSAPCHPDFGFGAPTSSFLMPTARQ